jgi:hypothetical protein
MIQSTKGERSTPQNTHTDHLQQQQKDLGNIIIIPLSNKIGEKNKKHTLHTKFTVLKAMYTTHLAAYCCFAV